MKPILHDRYTLKSDSDDNVMLTVAVGNGHLPITTVRIENTMHIVSPPANANGHYVGNFSIPLGTNRQLAGKHLSVSSTIVQMAGDPDNSVTITLNGGKAKKAYPALGKPAAGVGTTINTDADITLKNE